MIDETPYTREEIQRGGNSLPERGIFCPKCKVIIPQFADLADADRFRVKMLIINGQSMLAMAELKAATGCPLTWAKIWVTHIGKPEYAPEIITPCPHCGEPLRTPSAKQCRHCLMDWHDAQNPRRLR